MSNNVTVQIVQLPNAKDLPLPKYAKPGDAGMDLYADVSNGFVLEPGQIRMVSCGISIALPEGYEAQIRPRSGLALNGITIVNAPGTVDQGYRGTICVLLINLSQERYIINRGTRVAQMVVVPVTRVQWQPVEKLDDTERSDGGFGSTGV